MRTERDIDPGHDAIRLVLRVVGPAIAAVGLLLTAVGFLSFFSSFGHFGSPMGSFGPPRFFWCAFVGLPLLGLGVALTKFAYLGAVVRYVAGEVAPVGKDTFNYLAEGTSEGVESLAAAVGRGLREDREPGEPAAAVRCHKCNSLNPEGAHYCNACGAALEKSKPCPQCGELNDPDARHCDNCGTAF